jgi:hypothetical protein
MRSRTIVVEFVGMPGAGKTTISAAVIEELRTQGFTCPTDQELVPWRTTWGVGRFPPRGWLARLIRHSKLFYLVAPVRHPLLFLSALHHVLNVRPLNRDSLRAMRGPMAFMELSTKMAGYDNFDFVIFDEGMVQSTCVISQWGDSCSPKALSRHAGSLIKNRDRYLIILAKTSPDLALKRIRERAAICHSQGMQSWQYEDHPEEIQARKAIQYNQTFNCVGESLEALIPESVLELDCSEDANENANKVVKFLKHAAVRLAEQHDVDCARRGRIARAPATQ